MDIKKSLAAALKAAALAAMEQGLLPRGEVPEVLLEVPPQKEFGDFASNFAMQSARYLKRPPRVIAQALIQQLTYPYIEKVEIAGPGFLNFYLRPDWLYDSLREIAKAGEGYGDLPSVSSEKIQIEYVSANPTGPLHVGHGRGAAVGSALANLLRAAGYDVSREYYINDAGNQMQNLAASVNARYLELFGQHPKFPEDGYHGRDIVDTACRIKAKYGDSLLALPEEERLRRLRTMAYEEKLAALKEDLAAFRCEFDVWFSEQTLHAAHKIEAACDVLRQRGYLYEKDGALWLKAAEHGDDKDRVVIRDNGVPTYFAADIAYHWDKFQRGFDRVINIWGADHHGYIPRVKAAIEGLGYRPEQLEILLLQMVNLFRNGEVVKMSKRTGQSITLSELIEEVGTDAARFFFNMRSLDSQLDFDMTLAVEKSNDNPVYYVQYAHARIASILRQIAEEGIEALPPDEVQFDLLKTPEEAELIKTLSIYPELIAQAAKEREPHKLAHYVHALAGDFHSFYNRCRVLGAEPPLQQARLILIKATGHVLRHALGILGVSAPQRM